MKEGVPDFEGVQNLKEHQLEKENEDNISEDRNRQMQDETHECDNRNVNK